MEAPEQQVGRVTPLELFFDDIGAAHFVERHGLVIIIAIGESVVAIGTRLQEET